jgi:hypothetical protein
MLKSLNRGTVRVGWAVASSSVPPAVHDVIARLEPDRVHTIYVSTPPVQRCSVSCVHGAADGRQCQQQQRHCTPPLGVSLERKRGLERANRVRRVRRQHALAPSAESVVALGRSLATYGYLPHADRLAAELLTASARRCPANSSARTIESSVSDATTAGRNAGLDI